MIVFCCEVPLPPMPVSCHSKIGRFDQSWDNVANCRAQRSPKYVPVTSCGRRRLETRPGRPFAKVTHHV
jgi:hypothetical protein